jgi:hypothetical protein
MKPANGQLSAGYNRLVHLLDHQEGQRVEIARLRERNLELELLLRSALMELAVYHDEIPSRFRREWTERHDAEIERIKATL